MEQNLIYSPPRPDLTPADLLAHGYVLCTDSNGGWCWMRANPYGSGMTYGAPYARVEDACDSARWMAGNSWQLSLLEVTG